jgi:multicomponent Na+:H+ antiporter subunit D
VSAASIMVLAVAVPFAGAILIALLHRFPNLRETATVATAALLFALVVILMTDFRPDDWPVVELFEIFPGVAVGLAVEPLGMTFAVLASALWVVTSIYSIGYMRANREDHQTRYYVCFSLSLGATIGIAFAADLLTLFIFYEVLTLATYPLVTHAGTRAAQLGGRTYLGLLLGTSIGLLLLAIIITWFEAGTLRFAAGGIFGDSPPAMAGVLLVLFLFGIGKAALMPFHRWLPAAMVAPAPVSALLHAVAVVKAGVFTVLKVSVYVFGTELVSELWSDRWLLWVAAATIVIASLIALRQDDLKRRLAYSTVSQLSYIVVGALLANRAGIIGGGMHMATHAVGKITLFFCAGSIYTAARLTNVSEMRGLARRMPVTMAAFTVGSLSVIGLPPMAGVWSKWYLVTGSIEAGEFGLLAFLLVGSLLSAGYLLPVAVQAYLPTTGANAAQNTGIREGPVACLVALVLTALACLALFVFPDALYTMIARIAVAP